MRRQEAIRGLALASSITLYLSCCRAPEPSTEVEAVEVTTVQEIQASLEEVAPEEAPRPCPKPLDQDGVTYVAADQPHLPLVRYRDGQLSLSDSCAVREGNKLNRKIPPAYVNGRPIGFC